MHPINPFSVNFFLFVFNHDIILPPPPTTRSNIPWMAIQANHRHRHCIRPQTAAQRGTGFYSLGIKHFPSYDLTHRGLISFVHTSIYPFSFHVLFQHHWELQLQLQLHLHRPTFVVAFVPPMTVSDSMIATIHLDTATILE